MTKDDAAGDAAAAPGAAAREPESLDQLRGDCARMAERWPARAGEVRRSGRDGTRRAGDGDGPHPPRGVHVPARTGRLVEGMSDYGD